MAAPAPAAQPGERPIRTLTFTSLYPNEARPTQGIFVETRLRHLLTTSAVETRVVAPVPWFPLASPLFGSYADFAKAPRAETRFGIHVTHPRYPVIPKVGMSVAPALLYAWTVPHIRRLMRDGHAFDLIDAHYFYPDGVAAVMLARALNKPVVITARGTDINFIPRFALPRKMIQWAAKRAAGIITVCQALKDELVRLGVREDRIRVLRNGVDLQLFRPMDRAACRRQFELQGPTLLSVGNLIPLKRHDLVIHALGLLPGVSLLIVGTGPEEQRLRNLASATGVADRTRFLGAVPQAELAAIYGAADILVLASSREGWANVLLEAMACGTPVVATDIGGTPEVVAAPAAGRRVSEATPEAMAAAIRSVLAHPPERAATRAYAEGFGWDETTAGQLHLFRAIVQSKS